MEIKYNKPNYTELKQWYESNTDEYKRMLNAFINGEDISESEMFLLYYASIFTDEYAQYGHVNESVRSGEDHYTNSEEWLKKAKMELVDCPFDIRTLSMLDSLEEENAINDNDDIDVKTSSHLDELFSSLASNSCDCQDDDLPDILPDIDSLLDVESNSRCSKLCNVILHSGNGTEENPYYVIRVEDEYDFYNEEFFLPRTRLLEQQLIGSYIDKLTFETAPYKSHIVYFNMQPHMDRIHNTFNELE